MSTLAMPLTEAKAQELVAQKRKWTAAALAKGRATRKRRAREKAAALRAKRKGGKATGRSIARPRSREEPAGEYLDASLGRNSKPLERRKGRTAGEERTDAITYLEAATAGVAHVSNAELLALLALRRLRGQIK